MKKTNRLEKTKKNNASVVSIPIIDLPQLPPAVIDAYDRRELVVFIGAGISRLMGCQGWEDMANSLVTNLFDFAVANQIITSGMDSKAKITIAKRYAEKDKEKYRLFWRIFKKSLTPSKNNKDIYGLISQLHTVFITTNCDGLLVKKEFVHSYSTNCTVEEYENHKHKPHVFCIHGNYGNGRKVEKNSLVFTVEEYLKAYQPNNPLPKFLRRVMENNTVLFLGCGMSEFEILSAAFEPSNSGRHYLLEGFFEYQQELCNAYGEYYKSLGVNLIAYSKDKKGYRQQYDIIEGWIEELKGKTSYNSRNVQIITDALQKYNEENKEIIKRELSHNNSLREAYFTAILEELPMLSECYKWIAFLSEEKYISPESIPGVIKNEGGYQSNNWVIISVISSCLNNFLPNKEERELLIIFVKKCIRITSDREDVQRNMFTVSKLLEVYLQLGMTPKEEYEWSVWKKWAETSDYTTIVIENRESEFFNWPTEDSIKIIESIYSPGDETWRENKSYNIHKLLGIVVRHYEENTLLIFLDRLVKYLCQVEKGISFYYSIEDRYHDRNYGYSITLIDAISRILDTLCDDNQIAFVRSMYMKADDSYKAQLALYFTRLSRILNPLDYISNLLNYENCFVDFYYLLEAATKRGYTYSRERLELIVNWISKTSFGIDLGAMEDKEQVFYKKKIDTRKYQLYNLVVKLDNSFTYLLDSIPKGNRFEEKTPSEDKEAYYSVRFYASSHENEIDIDLDGMSAEELLQTIEAVYSKASFKNYYSRADICKSLIEKISDEQLESLLLSSFIWNDEELSAFTYCVFEPSVIKRCKKEKLNSWIVALYNRICLIKEPTETRNRLVLHLIYILQKLNECGWAQTEVLKIILKLSTDELFLDSEKYHSDMDIVMNLINVAESQLYILAIDTAAYCKYDEELTSQYKKWVDKNIINRNTKWCLYSCGFRLQNLLYIDREWANEVIMPKLTQTDKKKEVAICMCCGVHVVLDEVVKYITHGNTIEEIGKWIKEEKTHNRNADSVITYMVAARFFKKISKNEYWRVVDNIVNDNVNQLVWSINTGVKDVEFAQKLQLLKDTYYYYRQEHDCTKISVAIASSMSRQDVLKTELWELLAEVIHNCNNEPRIWGIISDCIRHTKDNNKYIKLVVESLCESSYIPDGYSVKRMMYYLAKIEAMDLVKVLANYAIGKGITPKENSVYNDNPQKILEDYKEYDI